MAWSEAVALALGDMRRPEAEAHASGSVSSPARAAQPLSARELEVAALVAEGCSNKEIGDRLVITPGTARVHVAHILDKLGLRSRAQIAAWVASQWIDSA